MFKLNYILLCISWSTNSTQTLLQKCHFTTHAVPHRYVALCSRIVANCGQCYAIQNSVSILSEYDVCKCFSRRNKILQHMECDRKCALPAAVHSVHLCSFVVFSIILAVPIYPIIELSCQGVTVFAKNKMYPKTFKSSSNIKFAKFAHWF